jgi:hypothetical protein
MTTCGRCGANLTDADLTMPSCRYCGTVHAHVARAAEKVAVVNALMGDANRNGIPDVFEGMARVGGTPLAPTGGPLPPGAVVVSASALLIGGGSAPPTTGGPAVGPVVTFGVYPQGGTPDIAAHARRGANKMLLASIVVVVGVLLVAAAGIAALLLMQR